MGWNITKSGHKNSCMDTKKNTTYIREDTHKKNVFFLVLGPLGFYPPYTGLVVHARSRIYRKQK